VVNEKPLELKRAVQFGMDICTGMTVAHQVGIVHRDLKLANVLINQQALLKIVDFGVAAAHREGDTQLTKTGYVIGSPKYMAPEQILGKKVDERADIYALGVIMYEMVTGVPPYSRGDHMSVMYQYVQGQARVPREINPALPPGLPDLVFKAMAVDKSKRHQSLEELRAAVGVPPMLRMHGDLLPIKFRDLRPGELEGYISEILTRSQIEVLGKGNDLDFSYVSAEGGRFRVNVFRKETGMGATFRAIPQEIPSIDRLALPPVVKKLCDYHQGMVLVTGATGTGKSTTLAAMTHHLNTTRL